MSLLNALLRTLFDLALLPFRGLHPMVGLTVISVGCAVLMLLGYRATSNQPAIETVKRKIAAGLFEIRLYNDDIVAILRAQGAILKHNMKYLALNMVPMVFMMVPFVLVIAQLQFHYGYRGPDVDEAVILEVEVSEAASAQLGTVQLDLPDGVRLDSPPVRMPTIRRVAWRVAATQAGSYDIGVRAGDETQTKSFVVGDSIVRRSPFRLAPKFIDQLLYPAEASLPGDSAITAIDIRYPDREVGLFGFEAHWLIAFFILTIVLAFAMKGWFGVTI